MQLLALQQAIGEHISIPYIGLLILGIVLVVLGWALQRGGVPGRPFWIAMLWVGVACIIIWVVLLVLSIAFGFVCC